MALIMGAFLRRRQLGGGLFWVHSEGLQLGIFHLAAGFLCTACRRGFPGEQPPFLWNGRKGGQQIPQARPLLLRARPRRHLGE